MRTLHLAIACLAITAAGCRTDNHTVLLERDLRMQEDRIYQLQGCLEDAQMAREATIRENEALKRELAEEGKGDSGGPPIGSDRGGAPSDIQSPQRRAARWRLAAGAAIVAQEQRSSRPVAAGHRAARQRQFERRQSVNRPSNWQRSRRIRPRSS